MTTLTTESTNNCPPKRVVNNSSRNSRGARLVKRALAASATDEAREEAIRVNKAAVVRATVASTVPPSLVDLVAPILMQNDTGCDTDDSEDDVPNLQLIVKNLKSPFAKDDILPLHQKRRASSVSPNAKAALKHLRAKRAKTDLSPIPSPPSPYEGILQYI
jgi:hypothetical protein